MVVYRLILFILIAFSWSASANLEAPQSFTYEGRLYDSSDNPLAESVTFRIQIFNAAKDCLLYEETQVQDLTTSNGIFAINVGTPAGDPKRSGNDPNKTMWQIFKNVGTLSGLASPECGLAGGNYTPAIGEQRVLRVHITPSSTGVAETLSPDQVMNSVPTAVMSESLQGIGSDGFVQITGSVTQTVMEDLAAGTSSLYLKAGDDAQWGNGVNYTMSGQVAIGTSTPDANAELEIQNNAPTVRLEANAASGGDISIDFNSGANPQARIYSTEGTEELHMATGNPLVDALIIDNAQNATFMSTLQSSTLAINPSGGTGGEIQLRDDDGTTNYVALKAPTTLGADVTWTLPATDGAANDFLQTDGAGNLTWAAGGAGSGDITDVTTGTDSGLTGGVTTGNANISVDINGTTAEATADDADTVLIYDNSGGVLRKQTRANFLNVGVANGQLIQADATGLPAIDGSQLTNVSGTDNTKVLKTGDTMTGTLNIDVATTSNEGLVLQTTDDNLTNNIFEMQNSAGTPLYTIGGDGLINSATDLTDKDYVDSAIVGASGSYVQVAGDTMTDDLIMGGSVANIQLGSNYLSGDGDDEGVYVTATGDVGVGTATPNSTFEVDKSQAGVTYSQVRNLDATAGSAAAFSATSDAGSIVMGVYSSASTPSGKALILNAAGGDLGIDNGGERITIKNDGKVGIGTTTPAELFEVAGDAKAETMQLEGTYLGAAAETHQLSLKGQNGGWEAGLKFGSTNTTHSSVFMLNPGNGRLAYKTSSDDTNFDEVFTIIQNGNVGIGDTNPSFPLAITKNDADAYIDIRNNSSTASRTVGLGITNHISAGNEPSSISLSTLRGNSGTPSATQAGDVLSVFNTWGYGATGKNNAAAIVVYASDNFTDSAGNSYMTFGLADTGNRHQSPKMTLMGSGRLRVGAGNNPAAKLDVEGNIKVGNDSATCTGSEAGVIRYNGGALELCNGSSFQALATGGGEANDATNIGATGVGIYKQKTGTDIELRKIDAGSNKVTVTLGTDKVDIDVAEANIDHDALANFVANEHVDHSAVDITAGAGLTGGGDLTTTRTLDIGAGTGITVNANDIEVDYGTTAGTAVEGNDSRIGDATKIHGRDILNSAPTDGDILTWVNGNNRWEAVAAPSGADHLGNHTATQALDMAGFDITNGGNISMNDDKLLKIGALDNTDEGSIGAGDVGKIWYNTDTNKVKYRDASGIQELGVAGAGITSFGGETGSSQSLGVPGTSGTAPAWTSSSNTHTLNIPMAATASVTAGLISKTQYDAFDAKVDATRSIDTNANSGLTGGGDLSTDRALSVDINGTTVNAEAIQGADEILVWDVTQGALRKMTRDNFVSGVDNDTTYSADGDGIEEAATVFSIELNGGTLLKGSSGLSVDVGTGNNQIVQLNGSAQLPAVNGTNLTNLDGNDVVTSATGNIAATDANAAIAELEAEKVSLAGDTMTGHLELDNQQELRLHDSAGAEYTALRANATVGTSHTYTLPAAPVASQFLTTDASGNLSWSPAGASDHGALTGLTDDDHTQYANINGRASGQTINGGTAANENLLLDSTANATKGNVLINPTGGRVGIGTSTPGAVAEINGNAGSVNGLEISNLGTASRGIDLSSSGLAGASDHDIYIDAANNWRADGVLNASFFTTTGTATASVFYDADDTSYFINPNTAGNAAAIAGQVVLGATTPTTGAMLDINGTGATKSSIIIPRDTVANRPATGVNGMIRYASDTNKFEAYENGSWVDMIGGGGSSSSGAAGRVQYSDGSGGFNAESLLFWDATNDRLGVGYASPTTTLEVADTDAGNQVVATIRNTDTGNVNTAAALHLIPTSATGSDYGAKFIQDRNSKLYISVTDSSVRADQIVVDGVNDRVGIGTATPDEKLEVAGNIKATELILTSDRSLKKDIKPLKEALKKVLKLRGVTYKWKNGKPDIDEKEIGFIAQEVRKIFPEVVHGKGEGNLGINYAVLTAALVEAIREQQDQIASQQKEIDSLKASMSEVMKRLDRLESERRPANQ